MTEEQLKKPILTYIRYPTTLETLKEQLDRTIASAISNLSKLGYKTWLGQLEPENYIIYKYVEPEVDLIATELYRQMIRDYNKEVENLDAKIANKDYSKKLKRKAQYEKLKLEFENEATNTTGN